MELELPDFAVITEGLRFPEGPVALADGSVLVVEIAGRALTRITPDGRHQMITEFRGAPNGAAVDKHGHTCYVCNNGGREFKYHDGNYLPVGLGPDYCGGSLQRVDLRTGEVTTLYDEWAGVKLRSLNDLVLDGGGDIWFTEYGTQSGWTMDRGAVFHAKADGSQLRRCAFPMLGPNGIGLSPDEQRLFVAETHTGRVWWFDIESPGVLRKSPDALIAGRGHLLLGMAGFQVLDSLAVDDEGWVAVATIRNGSNDRGGITAISPDGLQTEYYPMPDPFPTNICFGGSEMRTAFVTLSGSGQLIRFRWPRRGLGSLSRPEFAA